MDFMITTGQWLDFKMWSALLTTPMRGEMCVRLRKQNLLRRMRREKKNIQMRKREAQAQKNKLHEK